MGKQVTTTQDIIDPTVSLTIPSGSVGEILSEATDPDLGSVSKDNGPVTFVPKLNAAGHLLIRFTGLPIDPFIIGIAPDRLKDFVVNT